MIKDLKKICSPKVFEHLFNTYAKDLKRFIFFKTQDPDLTEDILQDAFVKLWDNCDNVNYDKVKSYLFTVANNLFLNIKKHEAVVKKHQRHLVKESTNESPEFVMLENEFYDTLQKSLNALPEKQREVFLMNRIEKKKYKEIADALNISVKAVEKRMHLAMKTLRETIGNI